MPNYVLSEVVFHNVGIDAQNAILDKTCSPRDWQVDFQILLPLPLNIWWGNVGPKHTTTFPDTALDWCRKNWGTKLNAMRTREIERDWQTTMTLRFETEWQPPYGWLVAIFNTFSGVSFTHNWLDEGAEKARTGVWAHGDGPFYPEWNEGDADDATYQRMHALLWEGTS